MLKMKNKAMDVLLHGKLMLTVTQIKEKKAFVKHQSMIVGSVAYKST